MNDVPAGDYRLPIQDALSRLARAASRDGDPATIEAFVSVHHVIRELRVRVTELEMKNKHLREFADNVQAEAHEASKWSGDVTAGRLFTLLDELAEAAS